MNYPLKKAKTEKKRKMGAYPPSLPYPLSGHPAPEEGAFVRQKTTQNVVPSRS
jgi:hypothetical protein